MYTNFPGTSKGWSVLVLVIIQIQLIIGQDTCGGYYDVSRLTFGTGTFNSPNYPAPYSPKSHCIWLVFGPALRTIQLQILTLEGESKNGECLDYLEVRAGSSTALQLYKGCNINTNLTIETPNRWLWVKFRSDEAVEGKGFFAIWKSTDNLANASYSTNPVIGCPSTRYTCLNKECVSYSWSCDGFNDCGCTEWGCDENPCVQSLLDSSSMRLIIGVSVGVVLTIFCVAITMWSERINPWPPFKKKAPPPPAKKK